MSSARVIGIGNEMRGDDAAGLLVARRVRETHSALGAQVLEHEGDPAQLIAAWEEATAVVLVDASMCGVAPGTVHRLDLSDGGVHGVIGNGLTHGLGLIQAVALARALGRRPAQIVIYGIEGADFGFGQPVSLAVAQVIDAVAARVAGDLHRFQQDSSR